MSTVSRNGPRIVRSPSSDRLDSLRISAPNALSGSYRFAPGFPPFGSIVFRRRLLLPFGAAAIEAAILVVLEQETAEHSDARRRRNRNQQTDKAEHSAEGRQRKHQPDRVQPDFAANQFRSQDISLDSLAENGGLRGESPLAVDL